jgi:plastocyanin
MTNRVGVFLTCAIAAIVGCSGDSGGGDPGGNAGAEGLNGCAAASAEDYTLETMVTIEGVGTAYTPKCIRIKAGTTVTFKSDFAMHPLAGGEVKGTTKSEDPSSPIQSATVGSVASFTFPNAGGYGYYCDAHFAEGMYGAIFVE